MRKIGQLFARFNSFLSSPSVTTENSKWFHCSNVVFDDKTRPSSLGSIDAKTSFSFLNDATIA